MSSSTHSPRPQPPRGGSLPDGIVAMLVKRLDEVGERLDALEGRYDDLAAQMAARSAARSSGPRPLDEVSIATLAFLREHASLRFTALSISENLDEDVTNEQVGSRLVTLLGRGLVLQHKREGKQALWQAAPDSSAQRNGEAAS